MKNQKVAIHPPPTIKIKRTIYQNAPLISTKMPPPPHESRVILKKKSWKRPRYYSGQKKKFHFDIFLPCSHDFFSKKHFFQTNLPRSHDHFSEKMGMRAGCFSQCWPKYLVFLKGWGGDGGWGLGVRVRMTGVFSRKSPLFRFFILWLGVAPNFSVFFCEFRPAGCLARKK